ncbi:unnamed protein product [Calicophoron daubneyi]|uniref:Uncharacterized protein n=1 Tax=Calicophoron daubneyi TaxID=300641 RepID=A0AAV2TIN7_CALDB
MRTILDFWETYESPHRTSRTGGNISSQRTVGPLARLWRAMHTHEKVFVTTRGLREPRALLVGKLIAFDRYWNLSRATKRTIRRRMQRQAHRIRSSLLTRHTGLSAEASGRGETECGEGTLSRRTSIFPSQPQTGCATSFRDAEVLAFYPRDHSLGTGGRSKWTCSEAQCRERIPLAPADTNCGSPTSGNTRSVKLSLSERKVDSPTPQSSSADLHQNQLFIRGANIISVNFPEFSG